jgi:(1->4)-alpha-D-glucan 1-alpha-D-glucosylmutase
MCSSGGTDSVYAGWFEIQWRRNKLPVPFLANQYGVELCAGKLKLRADEKDGSFAVWAYDTIKLPINPLHYRQILGCGHPASARLGDEFAHLQEWRPQIGRRAGELKSELARSLRQNDEIREAVAAAVARFNGVPGREETWEELDQVIREQYWRAADFRVAGDDINYRRFFNINELAGLRMELPDVFDHTHSLVFRLLADGTLDGLRIDHLDGLLNPKQYLHRLRKAKVTPEPFYVVEKILARYENLREDWETVGTTGYEFANLVLSLLIDSTKEDSITQLYTDFAGLRTPFAEVVRESKLRIMRTEMASELGMLAWEALQVAQQNPRTADFTHNFLRRGIREVIACFPVYRNYLDSEGNFTEEDHRFLDWAVKQARADEAELDQSVFDFIYELFRETPQSAGTKELAGMLYCGAR